MAFPSLCPLCAWNADGRDGIYLGLTDGEKTQLIVAIFIDKKGYKALKEEASHSCSEAMPQALTLHLESLSRALGSCCYSGQIFYGVLCFRNGKAELSAPRMPRVLSAAPSGFVILKHLTAFDI